VGEVIKGCFTLRSILYTFVFAVIDDFDNMVVVGLLQFKVNTWKFGGGIGMGNVSLDKALGLFKMIVVPVVLLLFLIEEFEGLCLVFLLVASSPIFNDFDACPAWGEG
jgi:hypothetical protein